PRPQVERPLLRLGLGRSPAGPSLVRHGPQCTPIILTVKVVSCLDLRVLLGYSNTHGQQLRDDGAGDVAGDSWASACDCGTRPEPQVRPSVVRALVDGRRSGLPRGPDRREVHLPGLRASR